MIGDYHDFLPMWEMMPKLSAEEIERFVALGKAGRNRLRSEDHEGAEAAFGGQLAIFNGNPDPFVDLALLEATRGAEEEAVSYLRDAVVRGFTDLVRIDRAESWLPLRRNPAYRELYDALPRLVEYEKEWITDWSSYMAGYAPRELETVQREQRRAFAGIDRMAPVFGARYTRLAKVLVDRVAAARLEAYVAQKREATDIAEALDHLMVLYTGGPMLHWGVLPEESGDRLARTASLLLEKFPESAMRPNALVASAMVEYSQRDKKNRLQGDASKISSSLNEVLARYPDSDVAPMAAVGLIRTEAQLGQTASAALRYREFREGHAGEPALLRVREDLGELALWLGGLPEFSAPALDGNTVDENALNGKVAVLDFWATWCAPCVEEFPTLQRIREKHGDDVVLLGINLDSAEDMDAEDLGQWVASRNLPGSHLHDGMSWESDLVKSFGVTEIPFNVVVGSNGAILAVNQHGKQLEKVVSAAIEK